MPEVGFELIGDRGAVIAEAELAWPAHGIAVLLPDQEAHAAAFAARGVAGVHGECAESG